MALLCALLVLLAAPWNKWRGNPKLSVVATTLWFLFGQKALLFYNTVQCNIEKLEQTCFIYIVLIRKTVETDGFWVKNLICCHITDVQCIAAEIFHCELSLLMYSSRACVIDGVWCRHRGSVYAEDYTRRRSRVKRAITEASAVQYVRASDDLLFRRIFALFFLSLVHCRNFTRPPSITHTRPMHKAVRSGSVYCSCCVVLNVSCFGVLFRTSLYQGAFFFLILAVYRLTWRRYSAAETTTNRLRFPIILQQHSLSSLRDREF